MTFFDLELKTGALISDSDETISYHELNERVKYFTKHYLDHNSSVLLITENNITSLLVYLSCIRQNNLVILLDSQTSIDKVQEIVKAFKPNLVVFPNSKNLSLTDKFEELKTFGHHRVFSITNNQYIETDTQLLIETSGSTGRPKFVRLSQQNLNSNSNSIIQALGMRRNDRLITTLPFCFAYGLSMINTHIALGASIVLNSNPINSPIFWNNVRKFEISSLGGVPVQYEFLSKLPSRFFRETKLKTLTQAGGRLDFEKVVNMSKTSRNCEIDFFVMYGQTEATARISVLPSELASEYPDSVGHVIPGGKVELDQVGESYLNSSKSHQGQLIYHGENVSLGYAENWSDLLKPDINKGVLRTGDIATINSNGLIFITGRSGRFLKINGKKLSIDSIQDGLRMENINAFCFQINDNLKICAQEELSYKAIQKVLWRDYQIRDSEFQIKRIPNIPVTSSGKIDYGRLESLYKEIS